jgi:hypothetical protein
MRTLSRIARACSLSCIFYAGAAYESGDTGLSVVRLLGAGVLFLFGTVLKDLSKVTD